MTLDEIEDKVEQWHADKTITVSLRDYLGMTRHEYIRWVLRGVDPGYAPTSRNWREGRFMGRAWGKAVRRYAPFVPKPNANFARAFRQGQIVRQQACRLGAQVRIARMLDQQGAQ